MTRKSALVLAVVLAGLAVPASAQLREQGAYEMVTTHLYENASFGTSTALYHDRHVRGLGEKVIILDKRSGALWAWSERQQAVMYLGQILPVISPGASARIIQVEPDQKSR
jgi:hypothetical protein